MKTLLVSVLQKGKKTTTNDPRNHEWTEVDWLPPSVRLLCVCGLCVDVLCHLDIYLEGPLNAVVHSTGAQHRIYY